MATEVCKKEVDALASMPLYVRDEQGQAVLTQKGMVSLLALVFGAMACAMNKPDEFFDDIEKARKKKHEPKAKKSR